MIFLKCKIRFIYVGFNCKRKKWGKKCLVCAIKGGGGRRLMANAILNFHFDFPHSSLMANTILNFHFDYRHTSLIYKGGTLDVSHTAHHGQTLCAQVWNTELQQYWAWPWSNMHLNRSQLPKVLPLLPTAALLVSETITTRRILSNIFIVLV